MENIQSFEALKSQIAQGVREVVKISTESDMQNAIGLCQELKRASNDVKAYFKQPKSDAYKAHKAISGEEKELLDPINAKLEEVKAEIIEYYKAQLLRLEETAKRTKALYEQHVESLLSDAANMEDGDAVEDILTTAEMLEAAFNAQEVGAPVYSIPGVSIIKKEEVVVTDESKVPCVLGGVVLRPVDKKAVEELLKRNDGLEIEGIEKRTVYSVRIKAAE